MTFGVTFYVNEKMVKIIFQKCIIHLMYISSINLFFECSVSKCDSIQLEMIGLKTTKNDIPLQLLRTKKDIENEELVNDSNNSTSYELEETRGESMNQSYNSTINIFENNSTLDPLTINETDVTTPLFSSNVTTNDSLVPMIDETPDSIRGLNGSLHELEESITTQANIESTTPFTTTLITPKETTNTEMPYSESTPTTLTHTSNQSPIFSTTISTTPQTSTIISNKNNQRSDMNLEEANTACVLETKIECKDHEIECYGWGEIDCGSSKRKRSLINYINNSFYEENPDLEVFKLSLEKVSQSETNENTKCILTPIENHYLTCKPQLMRNVCRGKTICKPKEKSSQLNGPMQLWKVGLIAGLTAVGGTIFIIATVVAYVSYNKLKVRPELSMNGYHNNPQNVTRV